MGSCWGSRLNTLDPHNKSDGTTDSTKKMTTLPKIFLQKSKSIIDDERSQRQYSRINSYQDDSSGRRNGAKGNPNVYQEEDDDEYQMGNVQLFGSPPKPDLKPTGFNQSTTMPTGNRRRLTVTTHSDSDKPKRLHSAISIPIRKSDFIVHISGTLQEFYKIEKEIGSGAYASVYKVTSKASNDIRAAKTINKTKLNPKEYNMMLDEFENVRKLDHPNIIKIFEIVENKKSLNLISELYTGGELFERLVQAQSFTEKVAAKNMHQILSTMQYCHSQDIVHRDLKPENILFQTPATDSSLVIIDFGCSQRIKPNEKVTQTLGTIYYLAPEVIIGNYDKKWDVWSCGVILYLLLCGAFPFSGETRNATLNAIKHADLEFFSPQWDPISKDAKDLISNMLERDISKRFSMEQAFNHAWVQQPFVSHRDDTVIVLENLKNHRASKKLEQAVITFISSQLTSIEETYELKQVFNDLDENGDGKLSLEELKQGYKIFGFESFDQVEEIMNMCDVDHSGFLDYTEFISASLNRSKMLSKDKLEAAFRAFDKDGSGKIGIDELKDMLEKNDRLAEDSEWHEVIKEADMNGDGEIDFIEFKDLMMKLL